jgi:hypothetical protein
MKLKEILFFFVLLAKPIVYRRLIAIHLIVRPCLYYTLEDKAWVICTHFVHSYIPLTLYHRRSSRGISDIPSRRPRFTKITYLLSILQTGLIPPLLPTHRVSCVARIYSERKKKEIYHQLTMNSEALNTADLIGGKPIAVWSQSISGVRSVNPLVALYDIHGTNREVLFIYFLLDTTRDIIMS